MVFGFYANLLPGTTNAVLLDMVLHYSINNGQPREQLPTGEGQARKNEAH